VVTLRAKDPRRSDSGFAQAERLGGKGSGPAADRFTILYRNHHQRIFEFACRRVGPDLALEVVSETFLVAWRKFADVPDEPAPWLYRVASFEIANLRRRAQRTDELHLALQSVRDGTDDAQPCSDLSVAVASAFDSLSRADREILRLATWERLTLAEGASVLGCSVSAYRMRLHRARARLGNRVTEGRANSRRSSDGTAFTDMFAGNKGMTNGVEVAL
jgi:RNA polymerase sigma-70 factor (ECF subfamily)